MKSFYLIFLFVFLYSIRSNEQDGTLNTNFGINGQVVGQDYGDCYAIALTKNDEIVMAGSASLISGFSVATYLPDGSPDSSFGGNGFVTTDFGYSATSAYGVAVQLDGKIIAAGCGNLNGIDILLARYNADGSLDQTFGNGGKAIANFGGWEYVTSMALQPDGKIVVCGNVGYHLMLVRFNTNGTVDNSFGIHGETILDVGGGLNYGTSVAVQPDGKIVQGGYQSSVTKFLLVRYLSNGSVDASFGQNGIVETDFNQNEEFLYALNIKANGIIDAAGTMNVYIGSTKENMCIAQYLENGTLDQTFGNNGKSVIRFGDNSSARAIAYQRDGKIILSGGVGGDATGPISNEAALARLNENGSIDTTFADSGKQVTDFGDFELFNGVALLSNGQIISGGKFESFGSDFHYDFALALYNNNNPDKRQILITKIKQWKQHHNGIEWDAASGTSGYAVQRSINGFNWSTVYHQQAGVQSQQTTTNHYEDPAPVNGINYYRLQTTAVNGAVVNSNIIAVSNDVLNIALSPNPAKSTLLVAGLPADQKVKIAVVDFFGNLKLQANANNAVYNLNIASLQAGTYVLKVETANNSVTKQFVKNY